MTLTSEAPLADPNARSVVEAMTQILVLLRERYDCALASSDATEIARIIADAITRARPCA